MTYLLLAADPDEKVWTILVQSDNPDDILDEIEKGDPSLRVGINTDDFIQFDVRDFAKRKPEVGGRVHGFANGYFGRDSYTCRTIEVVEHDYIVTRNDVGDIETLTLDDYYKITDPNNRDHCGMVCDG